tara:strand:- start:2061 stop:2270 length:210 start_codon:yes stop_codon:yes gene_type:complete
LLLIDLFNRVLCRENHFAYLSSLTSSFKYIETYLLIIGKNPAAFDFDITKVKDVAFSPLADLQSCLLMN